MLCGFVQFGQEILIAHRSKFNPQGILSRAMNEKFLFGDGHGFGFLFHGAVWLVRVECDRVVVMLQAKCLGHFDGEIHQGDFPIGQSDLGINLCQCTSQRMGSNDVARCIDSAIRLAMALACQVTICVGTLVVGEGDDFGGGVHGVYWVGVGLVFGGTRLNVQIARPGTSIFM